MWNFYRDEINDDVNENNDADNYRINNNKATTSKSLEHKIKKIGSTPIDSNRLDAEVVVSIKYLSNFWRYLDLPLINCEVKVDLPWAKSFIISEILNTSQVDADPNANPPVPTAEETLTTGATFQINNAKL